MSLALGDISKESLTALVSQGGSELDEFVDRVQKALNAAEMEEGALLREILTPVSEAIPKIVEILEEIKEQGLVITIELKPNTSVQPGAGGGNAPLGGALR